MIKVTIEGSAETGDVKAVAWALSAALRINGMDKRNITFVHPYFGKFDDFALSNIKPPSRIYDSVRIELRPLERNGEVQFE